MVSQLLSALISSSDFNSPTTCKSTSLAIFFKVGSSLSSQDKFDSTPSFHFTDKYNSLFFSKIEFSVIFLIAFQLSQQRISMLSSIFFSTNLLLTILMYFTISLKIVSSASFTKYPSNDPFEKNHEFISGCL